VDTFVCIACSVTWHRKPTRGRVPRFCPDCRPMAAQYRMSPDIKCVACGEPVRRADCYFCSKSCARRSRDPRNAEPKHGPATRVFITDCTICTKTFVSVHTVSTCSPACRESRRKDRQSDKDHRRRARERGSYVARVSPREIYERDKWRCHICRKPVSKTTVVPHPRAATIDHLIPLAAFGTHEPANVATAHFICNSRKGDRGGGEQLMLVG
jgi:predicted nucleic acid-binding Zn ribbon protein